MPDPFKAAPHYGSVLSPPAPASLSTISRRKRLWMSMDRWGYVAACENDHNPTLYRDTWVVVERTSE